MKQFLIWVTYQADIKLPRQTCACIMPQPLAAVATHTTNYAQLCNIFIDFF
jgi:hypothetical protein